MASNRRRHKSSIHRPVDRIQSCLRHHPARLGRALVTYIASWRPWTDAGGHMTRQYASENPLNELRGGAQDWRICTLIGENRTAQSHAPSRRLAQASAAAFAGCSSSVRITVRVGCSGRIRIQARAIFTKLLPLITTVPFPPSQVQLIGPEAPLVHSPGRSPPSCGVSQGLTACPAIRTGAVG